MLMLIDLVSIWHLCLRLRWAVFPEAALSGWLIFRGSCRQTVRANSIYVLIISFRLDFFKFFSFNVLKKGSN